MVIDGFDVDLTGLRLVPAMVNAHDHLDFALFPRLGNRLYANASEWSQDIYHPEQSPIRDHLRVPKKLRLLWGGLRNLIAGVTVVWNHNPWHPVFEDGFPVNVVKRFGWAHSLAFSPDVLTRFEQTRPDEPFIVHIAEGTDRASAREVFQLHEMGLLGPRTVLVHAVGVDEEGWRLIRDAGASIVWCPRSNLFTLGRTLVEERLKELRIPFALGTDSPLTAEGDFLDEIHFAGTSSVLRSNDVMAVRELGDPPELVIVDGRVKLISERLARGHSVSGWSRLHIQGRPRVLVPLDMGALIHDTKEALGCDIIRVGGRQVLT